MKEAPSVASCFWVALSRSRERSRLARRSAGAPFGRQATAEIANTDAIALGPEAIVGRSPGHIRCRPSALLSSDGTI
jgi:hypothetical protein